jgi:hypothetical protein
MAQEQLDKVNDALLQLVQASQAAGTPSRAGLVRSPC